METKKIITIRENLIREIEESGKSINEVAIKVSVGTSRLSLYLNPDFDDSYLNGEEIQRIFNYLNGLK